MASKLAEKAPGWATSLLLPEIQEMKRDIKALNAKVDANNQRIDATNDRIDSLRNELKSEIDWLDGKIDSLSETTNLAERIVLFRARSQEPEK